jgi:hypothetical protein
LREHIITKQQKDLINKIENLLNSLKKNYPLDELFIGFHNYTITSLVQSLYDTNYYENKDKKYDGKTDELLFKKAIEKLLLIASPEILISCVDINDSLFKKYFMEQPHDDLNHLIQKYIINKEENKEEDKNIKLIVTTYSSGK